MSQFNLIFFNKVLMSLINSTRDPLKKKKKRPTVHILKKKKRKKKKKRSQNANAEKQLYPNRYVASSGSLNP